MDAYTAEPVVRCVLCGAVLDRDVTICGGCGTPVTSEPARAPMDTANAPLAEAPTGDVDVPPAPSEQTQPATPKEATTTAMTVDDANVRLCEWCGARNPLDAERCVSCDAHFPRPEQDELLQRAFQERMALAEQEEQRRRKRGFWKNF